MSAFWEHPTRKPDEEDGAGESGSTRPWRARRRHREEGSIAAGGGVLRGTRREGAMGDAR